ncbi:hypothetical protein P4647_05950 [Peribacillus frigoritolerans]|uniref:hypothetical protein n=1 Tax=Peribacillus frigoritolerans TaxID=450367 RepID=UPI002E209282|nr:hypothetical protein [Peribacillus frigoritolerans]
MYYQRAVQLFGRLFSVSEYPFQACYRNKVHVAGNYKPNIKILIYLHYKQREVAWIKINVEIDEEIKAIEVLIRNHEWNEEVQELMERLKERKRPYFVGRKGEMQHVFRAEEIICLFTEQDSIMVRTKQGFSK